MSYNRRKPKSKLQVKLPYNLRPRQSELQDKLPYNLRPRQPKLQGKPPCDLRPRKSKQFQDRNGKRAINDSPEEQQVPRGLFETTRDLENNKLLEKPPKKRWTKQFLVAKNCASSQESTTRASFNNVLEYLSSDAETDQRRTHVCRKDSPCYGSNSDA